MPKNPQAKTAQTKKGRLQMEAPKKAAKAAAEAESKNAVEHFLASSANYRPNLKLAKIVKMLGDGRASVSFSENSQSTVVGELPRMKAKTGKNVTRKVGRARGKINAAPKEGSFVIVEYEKKEDESERIKSNKGFKRATADILGVVPDSTEEDLKRLRQVKGHANWDDAQAAQNRVIEEFIHGEKKKSRSKSQSHNN